MAKKSIDRIITAAVFLVIFLIAGCQQEKKQVPQTSAEQKKDTTAAMQQNQPKTDTLKKQAEPLPDITGTWTGKLEHHNSVLKITEQDSLNFKGNISTSFRNPIDQQISGKFDPVAKTLTMKDLIRNRYQGTYSAKLSEDLKSFSGTFKPNADNEKWTFNYKKK